MQVVSKQKCYMCEYSACGRVFKNMQNLRRHVDAWHRGKRYNCDVPGCLKSFSYPQTLAAHRQASHPERIGK